MEQFHTEREQGFVALATQLGREFSTRAAQYDELGEFPYKNYEELKETGYSNLTIPQELGGMGASLLERIKTQDHLARGCGATALAINMHFNVASLLIHVWHETGKPVVGDMLRKIASERLIVGGSGSEPNNAASILRPLTTATRMTGGWQVSGNKIFSTQSIAVDFYFGEATSSEDPGQIISFLIPGDSPGLNFKDDWNTMGMRSTESRSTQLEKVFVPDSSVFLERPLFARGGITRMFPRAPFTIGGVYIGIANAARDFVVNFMRDRKRFPYKSPMGHLPSVYLKVGEMDALLEGARAVMWKAAAEADTESPQTWVRKSVAARMIAMENSNRVVDLAMRAVGGASYFKRLPLERYHREVKAALFHPFDTDETLELLGKTAFGVPMYDEETKQTLKLL